MWDDADGLPPLEGIVAALEGFTGIGDADPLEVEHRVSSFLGMLGAGQPDSGDPDEPETEELLDGIVEICLHHLEANPPRVIHDFLWVLDAFDLPWLAWPLRERLAASSLPNRPAWAADVGQAEIVGTHVVTHETGDGIDVAIVARHRSARRDHVVAVYVDRTLGGLATDLLVHDDAEEYLRLSRDAPGMVVEALDPAVALATIDAAVDTTFEAGVPAAVADGFSPLLSLVEHYSAKLPDGGTALPMPTPQGRDACEAIVDRFLGGLGGLSLRADRDVLIEAATFVDHELGGDPLRWSAPVTQIVLGAWLPLADLGPESAERLPKALRAFIPWAHQQLGWGDRYLDEVLGILDAGATGEFAGGVDILEQAMAAGVDLDDPAALDAFLDAYLDEG